MEPDGRIAKRRFAGGIPKREFGNERNHWTRESPATLPRCNVRKLRILSFAGLNLLAAYAPGVLWVPTLPGSVSLLWKFVFSPVLLVLLILDDRREET